MQDFCAEARPLAVNFLLRTVRIPPGGLFCHMGKCNELSHVTKKDKLSLILLAVSIFNFSKFILFALSC